MNPTNESPRGGILSGRIKKLLLIFWILLVPWEGTITGWKTCASSDADPADKFQEYQLKAAFIYNFAKFIEWPLSSFQDEGSPFIVGVLGKDPFGEALAVIQGKKVGKRDIGVKHFDRLDSLGKCHILYISASEKDRLQKIFKMTEKWKVLTISDFSGFCQAGGNINFFIEEKRVRFEINLDSAQRNGLKISSQLLKLSKIVREE